MARPLWRWPRAAVCAGSLIYTRHHAAGPPPPLILLFIPLSPPLPLAAAVDIIASHSSFFFSSSAAASLSSSAAIFPPRAGTGLRLAAAAESKPSSLPAPTSTARDERRQQVAQPPWRAPSATEPRRRRGLPSVPAVFSRGALSLTLTHSPSSLTLTLSVSFTLTPSLSLTIVLFFPSIEIL
ncbi:hypothetical protein CDD83_2448 [Cordyceps sp. RAO-2017]|nr:hypothetical protein CDD83_2448 [Cordyceps sp. RAO-2017]